MQLQEDITKEMLSSSEPREESVIERKKRLKREYWKKYYEKNKEKVLKKQKIANKKYYEKDPERVKKLNREASKRWYLKNKDYQRIKRQTDPAYRLKKNMRKRVWDALKGNSKSKPTMELLGCTIEKLWDHLESQFKPGMTRENYGSWHVDHIIPCVKFDLTKEENQKMCFHYTNLQPLWAEENIFKSDKIL